MDKLTQGQAKRPYVLILSGPAGSGKSTVATTLWKELPDSPAYIDLDGLKNMMWQSPSDDHHLDLASRNALSLLHNFLESSHSVILDKAFGRYSFVLPFIEEASRWRCPAHYFKLTAPLDVLIQRNMERWRYSPDVLMQQARWRPFCAPDENVVRIFRFCAENCHLEGTEIDTSQMSLQAVSDRIRKAVLGTAGPVRPRNQAR